MTTELNLALFALIGGILPALVWLWFWLKEDKARPEPAGMIIKVFIAGSVSVIAAFFLERLAGNVAALFGWSGFGVSSLAPAREAFISTFVFLLVWAGIEELVKFAAAYWASFNNKNFNEPIDAMIYMVTAAIGFAAVENTLFLLSAVFSHEGGLLFIMTGNLRFLGATVVHIVSSALVGGLIALTFCSGRTKRRLATVIGLCTATALHAVFNFFIINASGEDMLKIFIVLWLAAIFIIYVFERAKRIMCATPLPETI